MKEEREYTSCGGGPTPCGGCSRCLDAQSKAVVFEERFLDLAPVKRPEKALHYVREKNSVTTYNPDGSMHATMTVDAFEKIKRDFTRAMAAGKMAPHVFVEGRPPVLTKPRSVGLSTTIATLAKAKESARQQRKRAKEARKKNR